FLSVDLHRLHAVADLDRVDDVHAARHSPERGVLPVQVARRTEHDVELTARRVGIALSRHPEESALELPIVELRLDRVAGTAGPHRLMVQRKCRLLPVPDWHAEGGVDDISR